MRYQRTTSKKTSNRFANACAVIILKVAAYGKLSDKKEVHHTSIYCGLAGSYAKIGLPKRGIRLPSLTIDFILPLEHKSKVPDTLIALEGTLQSIWENLIQDKRPSYDLFMDLGTGESSAEQNYLWRLLKLFHSLAVQRERLLSMSAQHGASALVDPTWQVLISTNGVQEIMNGGLTALNLEELEHRAYVPGHFDWMCNTGKLR